MSSDDLTAEQMKAWLASPEPMPSLSDAELAEMRAMLAEISTTVGGTIRFAKAAPESMARLLGEVERLQREQHKHDPRYCYDCQGVKVLLPVTRFDRVEASDD